MWSKLHNLLSLKYFFSLSEKITGVFAWLSLLLFTIGGYWCLFVAPPDYQQGDAMRIMYLHVPAAFLSLSTYAFMGFNACTFLIWRMKLSAILLKSAIPFGSLMTLLALVTGSIWGRPMWGTWWIWDARLTSELILLFIYLSLLLIGDVVKTYEKKMLLTSILVLVGLVDLPIIHYSVNWWYTLHQGASLSLLHHPKIAPSMLYPLLTMMLAFISFGVSAVLSLSRIELLQIEKNKQWVKEYLK